ncbi:DCAF15 [Cordylochernes scorpioides]|uniref:DCAF15 n=1 Tax=Cordylochernes scorpioides TaxID=51811 RepID=A0ABY6K819_9ARAC|nr:DCAF15 [Cordylochernes scorpioides]
MVSESILQSGHVFLGFTKDSQYVLSYTFQIESGDHSYFYQYRYKLHWWHFVPYRPLKKVYEAKLFGDQDISQELKLAVCQWPTDDTKLLVYGCCPSSTCSEDSDPPGSPRPPRRFRLPSEELYVHSPPGNGPLSPQDPKFMAAKQQSVANTKHKFFGGHKWKDEDPKTSKRKEDFFGFESGKPRKGPSKAGGDHCTGDDKRKRNESVKENISPVYRKHVEAAAAPVERKCVTEVTQWFVDIFPATDRGQGEEGEEEYHQILPLDVRGTNSVHLRPLTPAEASQCKDSLIRTHQLSLDIEKLAHETAQQLCAEAGRKFLAFNDYDVGIIDLCPLTHTAFCLVFMLIHATIGKKGVAKAFRSAERKEFQTSFRFNWDINTGIYTIVEKDELREYDPYSVNGLFMYGFCEDQQCLWSRPEGLWSPAQHTIKLLHKEHLLPRSPAHSVNVLTNASVFRGSSLRALWAPNHHIAIVL